MLLKKINFIVLSMVLALNANAYVELELAENSTIVNKFAMNTKYLVAHNKKDDLVMIYNKQNEVIYFKHKNLGKTFKIPYSKISNNKFMTNLKPEEAELTLANYKTDLHSINFGGRKCLEMYGSRDLGDSLSNGVSSFFAIYKAYVYMSGQMLINKRCENLNIAKGFDKKVGVPLAIFYQGEQLKVDKVTNNKQKISQLFAKYDINLKKAVAPNLNLQYEIMYSLLTEKQQESFNSGFADKSISVKIKAIDNLLKGF